MQYSANNLWSCMPTKRTHALTWDNSICILPDARRYRLCVNCVQLTCSILNKYICYVPRWSCKHVQYYILQWKHSFVWQFIKLITIQPPQPSFCQGTYCSRAGKLLVSRLRYPLSARLLLLQTNNGQTMASSWYSGDYMNEQCHKKSHELESCKKKLLSQAHKVILPNCSRQCNMTLNTTKNRTMIG